MIRFGEMLLFFTAKPYADSVLCRKTNSANFKSRS